VLAGLAAVDYVLVFDEPTPHEVLWRLRPELLVKGGTYLVEEVVGREIVEGYGGQVLALGWTEGVSTTALVASIAGAERAEMAQAAAEVARDGELQVGAQLPTGVN
jgi:D-beta-D-heptose 7-phosphate kinase/D-beta-D-heptose 1-phosphate adenosyltransferase